MATHKADVLCLAVADEGRSVYASGVDSTVVKLQRAGKQRPGKWVLTAKEKDHTHDVRALALGPGGEVVTGGVDTNLITYAHATFGQPRGVHRKIPPFPHRQFVHLARETGLVLHEKQRVLQFWALGAAAIDGPAEGSMRNGERVAVEQRPRLLLEVEPKSSHHIQCSALSSDGALAAFSNRLGPRVFDLEQFVVCFPPNTLHHLSIDMRSLLHL